MGRKEIPEKLKKSIRRESLDRCGYCKSRQDLVPVILQIDHIMPLSIGGSDDEANLWLLCPSCNLAKGKHSEGQDELTDKIVPLFNPRTQNWNEHFEWSSDTLSIMGKSAVGRVTVRIAKLNSDLHRRVRANWIRAGVHPPSD